MTNTVKQSAEEMAAHGVRAFFETLISSTIADSNTVLDVRIGEVTDALLAEHEQDDEGAGANRLFGNRPGIWLASRSACACVKSEVHNEGQACRVR